MLIPEGSPENIMRDRNTLVISENVKNQLFGKEGPGKNRDRQDSIPLTVSGVVDIPANSSLRADVFLPVQFLRDHTEGFEEIADWYNTFAENYLLLREGAAWACWA